MSNLPPKKEFTPLATQNGGFGSLAIGEDGTVLYRAIDVETGQPVTVCIYSGIAYMLSFMDAIATLTGQHKQFLEQEPVEPKQDFTPADQDFQAIMDSLKNGTKH